MKFTATKKLRQDKDFFPSFFSNLLDPGSGSLIRDKHSGSANTAEKNAAHLLILLVSLSEVGLHLLTSGKLLIAPFHGTQQQILSQITCAQCGGPDLSQHGSEQVRLVIPQNHLKNAIAKPYTQSLMRIRIWILPFHFDEDPNPSFQGSNSLIFHTFRLGICKLMRIRIQHQILRFLIPILLCKNNFECKRGRNG